MAGRSSKHVFRLIQPERSVNSLASHVRQLSFSFLANKLEFSLLALHTDTLPALEAQLVQVQSSGNDLAVLELSQQISNEKAKRERWAVSFSSNPLLRSC